MTEQEFDTLHADWMRTREGNIFEKIRKRLRDEAKDCANRASLERQEVMAQVTREVGEIQVLPKLQDPSLEVARIKAAIYVVCDGTKLFSGDELMKAAAEFLLEQFKGKSKVGIRSEMAKEIAEALTDDLRGLAKEVTP